jgi:hypothetical protein
VDHHHEDVRDLGGLPLAGGGQVRPGAVSVVPDVAPFSGVAWASLRRAGVRTVVAVRTAGGPPAREPDPRLCPPDVRIRRVVVEDVADASVVQRWAPSGLWCTPLSWRDSLRRWPDRWAVAVGAVAHAWPGGVVVSGDRGLLVCLLLGLAGVPAEVIADDWAGRGGPALAALARVHASPRDVVAETLASLDLATFVPAADVAALRERLAA